MHTKFFQYLSIFICRYKKAICYTIAFLMLLLFGDTLLSFIGHCLYLLLEVIESILEHFLESAFGLSARQAQLILFYSFLVIIAHLLWVIAQKTYLAALQLSAIIQTLWRSGKAKLIIKAILLFFVLGTGFYTFS